MSLIWQESSIVYAWDSLLLSELEDDQPESKGKLEKEEEEEEEEEENGRRVQTFTLKALAADSAYEAQIQVTKSRGLNCSRKHRWPAHGD